MREGGEVSDFHKRSSGAQWRQMQEFRRNILLTNRVWDVSLDKKVIKIKVLKL